MLQPGGDPEEFAYNIAEKSERNSDQFVLGYEGMLTDNEGNKQDAFIIKGYDKTQPKGVFIAQIFEPKEKTGSFKLFGTPIFIGNPDLPFAVNATLLPNYNGEQMSGSLMALKNNDQIVILSNSNVSVVASALKNSLRILLQSETSSTLSGNIDISIAPQSNNNDFFKYTIARVAKDELNSPYVKEWEIKNEKSINLICTHGDDLIYQNTEPNRQEEPKEEVQDEHQSLVESYKKLSKIELDKEFQKIVTVPNAQTNIDCLKKMTALIEVYKSKGIPMPGDDVKSTVKPKNGCLPLLIVCIIFPVVFSMLNLT